MLARKKYLTFIILLLLIFALLTYQGIKRSKDTAKFDVLHYPIQILEQGISDVTDGIVDLFNTYILIAGKEDENKRLMERIKEVERERNEYVEALHENERLRHLLDLKQKRADYVTTAEVFARDPTNWFQVLWIRKGMKDNILKDMIAVTPSGAVGRIHRVLNRRSNIVLITDVNSSVAVRLQSSRIEGILEGRGDDKCNLKYIPQDINIVVGDKVVTSGLDGIYPDGFLVGAVSDVKKKTGEFFQTIEVTPAQNPNTVEEVLILKR